MKHFFLPIAITAAMTSAVSAQSASRSGPNLFVYGSGSSDTIEITSNPQTGLVRVRILARTSQIVTLDRTFPVSGIATLWVDAFEGDDRVVNGTYLTSVLRGGFGNDEIFGGTGSDRIYGDVGADSLSGGRDIDFLYGGAGADALGGGDGDDVLDGEEDNDGLYGGNGNDYLAGGLGADYLSGDGGDDRLNGGRNSLQAEDGAPDAMIGGSGNDHFTFEPGDARVGNHGTPGYTSVFGKWWEGLEPWYHGPYDSPPIGDPRGLFSPCRTWQCSG